MPRAGLPYRNARIEAIEVPMRSTKRTKGALYHTANQASSSVIIDDTVGRAPAGHFGVESEHTLYNKWCAKPLNLMQIEI
jgi:hypothetical protein